MLVSDVVANLNLSGMKTVNKADGDQSAKAEEVPGLPIWLMARLLPERLYPKMEIQLPLDLMVVGRLMPFCPRI